MANEKILVVEDERIVALDIKHSLESFGYVVPCMASTGEDAIQMAKRYKPDLVLMDIVLKGDIDGIEAATVIHNNCRIPVVYLTAYSDERTLQRAKMTEPFGHILKPFDNRELRTNIEIALHKRALEQEKLFNNDSWINSLMDNVGDAVISTDASGRVTHINLLAQALTGYRLEEAIGEPVDRVFKVICETTGKAVPNPTKKALREGTFYGLCEGTVLISKEQNHIPVDVIGSPIRNIHNETIGAIIVFCDITERRDIERSFLDYIIGPGLSQTVNH
ncbi:response regulator [Methanolobus chelungpuianus]|uniref:Histidine kinase n=1 Tax=Methanolobus chelungpuianus TaxID=502115 RepID=A0AAE3KW65_9EURY|nr:response regulator [Methanolobus chelungpuianus]MCQ6962270.1 histidine kinase [Methanolobus chelungpuianus]